MTDDAETTIRPAVPGDAQRIAEIHVQAWQQAYAHIVSAEHLASLSIDQRAAMWREAIAQASPELLVASAEGRVIGWVSFGPTRDAGAPDRTGEVWALYVDPAHWAAGVGRQLWQRARERLGERGFVAATLWVLAANARAIRFYEATGFVVEAGSEKSFELGGRQVREVRCRIGL